MNILILAMADRGHYERNCSNFFIHWLKKIPKPPEQATQHQRGSTLRFHQAFLYCTMLPSRVKGLVCLLLVPGDRPQTPTHPCVGMCTYQHIHICGHEETYFSKHMCIDTYIHGHTFLHSKIPIKQVSLCRDWNVRPILILPTALAFTDCLTLWWLLCICIQLKPGQIASCLQVVFATGQMTRGKL